MLGRRAAYRAHLRATTNNAPFRLLCVRACVGWLSYVCGLRAKTQTKLLGLTLKFNKLHADCKVGQFSHTHAHTHKNRHTSFGWYSKYFFFFFARINAAQLSDSCTELSLIISMLMTRRTRGKQPLSLCSTRTLHQHTPISAGLEENCTRQNVTGDENKKDWGRRSTPCQSTKWFAQ